MKNDHSLTRRTFLGTAAAAGVAATARPAWAKPAKEITTTGAMPEVAFGKTGHTLPVFCQGTATIIESEGDYYGVDVPDRDKCVEMVRAGYDAGIRYFDTARIYGQSEKVCGKALADVKDNCFINSKVLVDAPEKVRPSVEKSLKDLDMDSIDAMQIHGPSIERLGYDGCMPLYEELAKLRDEGLFRFIGITGHSRFEEMYKLIDTGEFDTLLIEFGYFHKGYNTRHSDESVEWREKTVARASELGCGILAMKIMGAYIFGHNAKNLVPDFPEERRAKLAASAIKHVYNDKRIHLLNIGCSKPEDITTNIELLNGDLSYTEEDEALLAEYAALAYDTERVKELRVV